MKWATLIIILIIITTVSAQDEQTANLKELETKRLIIEENAKSTAAIKQYWEQKRIDYNRDTQKMIDDNFQVLDQRLNSFLRNAAFKIGIIFFSGLVLAQLLVFLIKKRIEKKSIIRKDFSDQRHREQVNINLPTMKQYETTEPMGQLP